MDHVSPQTQGSVKPDQLSSLEQPADFETNLLDMALEKGRLNQKKSP